MPCQFCFFIKTIQIYFSCLKMSPSILDVGDHSSKHFVLTTLHKSLDNQHGDGYGNIKSAVVKSSKSSKKRVSFSDCDDDDDDKDIIGVAFRTTKTLKSKDQFVSAVHPFKTFNFHRLKNISPDGKWSVIDDDDVFISLSTTKDYNYQSTFGATVVDTCRRKFPPRMLIFGNYDFRRVVWSECSRYFAVICVITSLPNINATSVFLEVFKIVTPEESEELISEPTSTSKSDVECNGHDDCKCTSCQAITIRIKRVSSGILLERAELNDTTEALQCIHLVVNDGVLLLYFIFQKRLRLFRLFNSSPTEVELNGLDQSISATKYFSCNHDGSVAIVELLLPGMFLFKLEYTYGHNAKLSVLCKPMLDHNPLERHFKIEDKECILSSSTSYTTSWSPDNKLVAVSCLGVLGNMLSSTSMNGHVVGVCKVISQIPVVAVFNLKTGKIQSVCKLQTKDNLLGVELLEDSKQVAVVYSDNTEKMQMDVCPIVRWSDRTNRLFSTFTTSFVFWIMLVKNRIDKFHTKMRLPPSDGTIVTTNDKIVVPYLPTELWLIILEMIIHSPKQTKQNCKHRYYFR